MGRQWRGMMRSGVKKISVCCIGLAFLIGGGRLWANGNVSADEAPSPVKKSVQKAPIKKSVPRKQRTKKKKSKAAPVPAPKKPAQTLRLSSLQQGVLLMRQERYQAAYPWLQKAVQQERRNPEAWYWYGMYHEKTAQFEEAQFFYRKAMALDPGFEPFSRVVAYPGDGERVPLWDPKRPARVYPIPTNDRGIAIIPPDSPQARRRPVRPPMDPELPKVPVYVPPEPGAGPFDGDAWQPSVYVPPGRERLIEGGDPAYIPPESRVATVLPPPPSTVVSGGGYGAVLPPRQAHGAPGLPAPASPVYRPPLPDAKAAGAEGVAPNALMPQAPAIPASPGAAELSGNAPVYRPPMPGSGAAPFVPASGDQPVYQPPLPADVRTDTKE